ncbi:hypothetical protein NEOLEDRAFT_1170352 [Neolentinus lepideus HHB14362 ss-1]|uniref:Uncharacterized protein n=1 Tax=Neolentinus lepideus HHB14362 ss-1 TaxID=1314782 RepID=A0A165RN63_9AGAM|nr:hypothetical protein NEOLEDRAFT_1170352 [Neolentinus lepideus HHB14362 ss-1]
MGKKCKRRSHRSVSNSKQNTPPCWPPNPPNVHRTVSVKGILLPADEDEPRFVDVECAVHDEHRDRHPGYGDIYDPDTLPFLGITINDSRTTIEPVIWGARQGPVIWIGEPFVIISRNDALVLHGSPVNRCIKRLTGIEAHRWAGDVLVIKCHRDNPQYNGKVVDAGRRDLSVIVWYLTQKWHLESASRSKRVPKATWIVLGLVALLVWVTVYRVVSD